MFSKYAEQYAEEYDYQVVENISYDSNRAGSTDSEAIREALPETNMPSDKLIMPWDGVKFDQETHQNILGKGIICQIIDQEYYTVWPWNLATKELIWPMP
jgi:branched-chain amino acid transport system substrate-binding protein